MQKQKQYLLGPLCVETDVSVSRTPVGCSDSPREHVNPDSNLSLEGLCLDSQLFFHSSVIYDTVRLLPCPTHLKF